MDSSSFADAFQELNQRFVRLVDDLSALRILADIDLKGFRQEEVLQTAVHALLVLGEFEHCSIFIPREERLVRGAAASWKSTFGRNEQDGRGGRDFHMGEGLIGHAAQTHTLLHCPDTAADPRFLRLQGREIGALICAPVVQGGELLGVINASHSTPHSFQARHEELLGIFANFLAQALISWRYFHRLDEEAAAHRERLNQALHQAEALERRYRELAVVDELTGIHNRRFFFPEADAALAGALRHRLDFSVLLMDLDRFREINERLGRAAGDEALQITAALLEGQKRESDILARFGGDEFVLALPNTDPAGAQQLANRILQTLRALSFEHQGNALPLRASIGIASLDEHSCKERRGLLESLLQRADQALHLGKVQGRDQVKTFGEPLPAV